MSGRRVRLARLAAAAALVAAAAALAGCGSGHHPPRVRTTTTAASPRPAPVAQSPSVGPDGTAESGPATREATVPKAHLTPATGTFTARERQYLVGRVPVGMDPSSVLEDGQDVCERIAEAASASEADARAAVTSGELTDARAAITYLCPKYTYLLKPS